MSQDSGQKGVDPICREKETHSLSPDDTTPLSPLTDEKGKVLSNIQPTEEELRIAAKVLEFYAASTDNTNLLKSISSNDGRTLRKSVHAIVDMSSKDFYKGMGSEQFTEKKKQDRLEKTRQARVKHLKELDRQHINNVQLRAQRIEALTNLCESQPVEYFTFQLTGPSAPQLTDESSSNRLNIQQTQKQLTGKGPTPVNNPTGSKSKRDNMESHKDSTIPPFLASAFPSTSTTTSAMLAAQNEDENSSPKRPKSQKDEPKQDITQTLPQSEEDTLLGRLPTDEPGDFPSQLNFTNSCYVCKRRYTLLHKFYHSMCPSCARLNWIKRNQVANLTSYTALLTGSRVKIGFECGLKLLRCGATVIATSRFPHDTAKRYAEQADYEQWKHRLHIFGLDLRDLKAVISFTEMIHTRYGVIDIIVNNAAQTVRRPVMYYRHLLEDELKPKEQLPEHIQSVIQGDAHSVYEGFSLQHAQLQNKDQNNSGGVNRDDVKVPLLDGISGNHDCVIVEEVNEHGDVTASLEKTQNSVVDASVLSSLSDTMNDANAAPSLSVIAAAKADSSKITNSAASLSQMVISDEDKDEHGMAKFFPVGMVDVTGQQLDLRPVNSWLLTLSHVEPGELVETFAINALAPFIINSRLLPAMRGQEGSVVKKPRFIINVSAMEGKFYRHKGPQHPHTNMAKAALNMMTRTSAQECVKYSIYMNSVDTGWINDENPFEKAQLVAQKHNFQTPIDEVDAMARILDPILDAINIGVCVWGKFLKDYRVTEW